MNRIQLIGVSALAALAFGMTALAAPNDPTPSATPFPIDASSAQPTTQGSAAVCPVASAASTQPTASLDLRVIQGTPGGPSVGADAVTLALFSNGQLIDQAKATLTKDGTLQVKGLPMSAEVQPVVTIDHAGVTFTAVGDPLDATHVSQKLDLTIYETTEAAPKWSVVMRHIMAQPSKTGVAVMDMLSIHNPDDHAWIGKADANGQKQTISLPLPPGATDVKFGGDLGDSAATVQNGILFVHQALLPGDCQYEIQYTLPTDKGSAKLTVAAPTDVQHVLVFVPDDGSTVTTTGLQTLDPKQLGQMGSKTRAYMATSLTAGKTVSITFSDLRSEVPPSLDDNSAQAAADVPQAPAGDSRTFPVKVLAVAGATTILMGGGSVLLFRSPRRSK